MIRSTACARCGGDSVAYMFGTVDENEAPATTDADAVTRESTTLRKQAIAAFFGSLCLLPWLAPVAAFGMIATGAIILATKPTADCQEQITAEIQRKRFGCAWVWWLLMAAIIIGAAYMGMAGGALAYIEMRGL